MAIRPRRYPFSILNSPWEADDLDMQSDPITDRPNLSPKRDWRASVFDRLMPHGDNELEDGDKSRLLRQGLLQLGAGLLSTGGGFSNALGQGISGGLLAMNKGQDDLADRQYKRQMMQNQMGDPSGLRQFQGLAEAAGYKPGSPEYRRAAGTQLGQIGRASSAGFSFDTIDWGGTPVQTRRNGATGEQSIWNGEQWLPMDGMSPPGARATPQGARGLGADVLPQMEGDALHSAIAGVESNNNPYAVSPRGAMGTMQTMPDTLRDPGYGVSPANGNSPQEQTRVGRDYADAMVQKYGPIGGLAAYNWGPGNWEAALSMAGGDPQRALQFAPAETQSYVPKVMAQLDRGGLGVGRPKEAEAGAVTAAQEQAKIDRLPESEKIKADAAIFQAGGTEAVKRQAAAGSKRDEERIKGEVKLQGMLGRQEMVSEAIDDALAAPGFDANFGLDAPRRFIPGTGAANAKTRISTVLNQIRLNVLSDLKALSPNGGAVGQVSNEEGRIMAGYLGALENSTTDAEARRVMRKIKERMASMSKRLQDALRADAAGAEPAQHGGGNAPTRAIKRTGTYGGRKVTEYTDGSVSYAD